jgi:pyruvate formate lyase activating enzyme
MLSQLNELAMGDNRCALCGARSRLISSALEVCLECVRRNPQNALSRTQHAHSRSRDAFNLPVAPPHSEDGIACGLCSRQCNIPEGERGFCGLRYNQAGRLVHLAGTPKRGLLHWYRDPLPTNCVADWVCPGHTRYGDHNLAIFYASCTLNCLFCQNWHFRQADPHLDSQGSVEVMSAEALTACANEHTYCVCFFGGDPASQMPHALAAGKTLANRGVRVCWETAGTMHPKFMQAAVDLSLRSGGCIKFDLKAYDPTLHRVLTGASNKRTLENFSLAASRIPTMPSTPLVVASTLLVPGYVDVEEVSSIANFIARINPDIPYALLAFHPDFFMRDLPYTSMQHAHEALNVAKQAGLRNVRLGNVHLLSHDY